jgi:hypothetical protein
VTDKLIARQQEWKLAKRGESSFSACGAGVVTQQAHAHPLCIVMTGKNDELTVALSYPFFASRPAIEGQI